MKGNKYNELEKLKLEAATECRSLEEKIIPLLQPMEVRSVEFENIKEAIRILTPIVEEARMTLCVLNAMDGRIECPSESLEDTVNRALEEPDYDLSLRDPYGVYYVDQIIPVLVEMICVFRERSFTQLTINAFWVERELSDILLSQLRGLVMEVLIEINRYYHFYALEDKSDDPLCSYELNWPTEIGRPIDSGEAFGGLN